MRATDIIMKKRGTRGGNGTTTLTREEIQFLVDGYVAGDIPDYQIAAWLMAVYFNGMTFEETGALTDCMLHSGDIIALHGMKGLTGPFIDKHSTGGVGDKISLPLAPIVAACGIQDPMMSGRALGHTGGTLDKLESIAGYDVRLTPDQFRAIIADNGFAMMGQTPAIAPADKKMYALRDVTGTVESIPLITASILSKKVAEGADGLVFDVKCGSGAFMKTPEDAETLATSLVRTAAAMGKKASALITNMNTPLGTAVGNFLEIEETLSCLQGNGPADVMELTYALGAEMLLLGGKARDTADGRQQCEQAVASGEALRRFLRNVEQQGGNPDVLLAEQGTRRSPFHTQIRAERDGFLRVDAFKTGLAGVYLGVGRNKTTESVCADAGMLLHKKTGDSVRAGDILMDVYGKDDACLEPAVKLLKEEALTYTDDAPAAEPLIYKEIR
ncbi:MAG: thymidine phosphorylase [Treponemataceae bacterium]|nr:thymidine phosphorylase [Treponemataceae bacterium]